MEKLISSSASEEVAPEASLEASSEALLPAALLSGCSSAGTMVNTPLVFVTSMEATSASSRFNRAISWEELVGGGVRFAAGQH